MFYAINQLLDEENQSTAILTPDEVIHQDKVWSIN